MHPNKISVVKRSILHLTCLLCLFLGFACSAAPFNATVTLDVAHPGAVVNRQVLGNNAPWADNGGGILSNGTQNFAQPMLANVQTLKMSVLRYPGGTLSDLYHWRNGIGVARGQNQTLATPAAYQLTALGTQEFLELCEATGASPLITVNVMTGTAQEAADWVSYVNAQNLISSKTGAILPKVRYWEIGNEPYLQDNTLAGHWVDAYGYVRLAKQFVAAMKAVDRTIQVGIPLRSDTLGGVPATPYPGWNNAVLAGLQAYAPSFDYVSVHNAYVPYAFDGPYTDAALYGASMAGSQMVASDLASTRAQLRQYYPGRTIPMAVTEYNSFYTVAGTQSGYIETLGGALYIADMLRLMAQTSDVLMGNFWSMSDNWLFGALDSSGNPRPAYYVLKGFSDLLVGNAVPLNIQAPVTSTFSRVGVVSQQASVPVIAGFATLQNGVVRAMLINKDPANSASVALSVGKIPQSAQYTQVSGGAYFDTNPSHVAIASGAFAARNPINLSIPAHSVQFISMVLGTP